MKLISGRLVYAAIIVATVNLVAQSASAANNVDNSWYFGVGGGNTWINFANSELIDNATGAPPPYNNDTYTVNGEQAGYFQLDAGYRWHRTDSFLPYYAAFAEYSHFFRSNVSGEVTQFSAPPFENYNYKMAYTADMFTVNGKFDLVEFYSTLPYVLVGAGVIFNHVNSYSESELANVTPRTSPGYEGNSAAKLAGTLGAGFDFIITKNYWLTVGYEHVFQGDLMSGPGVDAWSNTKLNFGNTKMDTAFVMITANYPQGFRG